VFIEVLQGNAPDVGRLEKSWKAALAVLDKRGDRWRGATAGTSDDGHFVALLAFESEEGARNTIDRMADLPQWKALKESLDDLEFHECPNVRGFVNRDLGAAASIEIALERKADVPSLLASYEAGAVSTNASVLGGLWFWSHGGLGGVAFYRPKFARSRLRDPWFGLERSRRVSIDRPWSIVAFGQPARRAKATGVAKP